MLHFDRMMLVVTMTLMLLFATKSCLGFSTGFPSQSLLSRPHSSSLTSSYSKKSNSNSNLHLKSDGLTAEERDAKIVKATKAMTAFTNKYLVNTETTLCTELSIPAVVIKGLAEHKVDLGAPLCPCRFYEDKEKEVKDGYWNCPCVPMREEKKCHCMLFLTEDNAFAGDSQVRLYVYYINLCVYMCVCVCVCVCAYLPKIKKQRKIHRLVPLARLKNI
jgi:ferredoxin-thioredoxin reductase catalytic chain